MKTRSKKQHAVTRRKSPILTLGDLIAATYNACGEQAPKLLQLAIKSEVVRYAPRPVF